MMTPGTPMSASPETLRFAPAPPSRFEAGTPPIAQAVGLGAAVDYLSALGMENVAAHEQAITAHALERLGDAAEVAHAVVDQADAAHGQTTPWAVVIELFTPVTCSLHG